ncbi:IclR family transcriptional regulator [Allopusillimonas ginsengisoli]|nr:IclR family transcriptional regulator [Allopusillimonas ginsengisoli]
MGAQMPTERFSAKAGKLPERPSTMRSIEIVESIAFSVEPLSLEEIAEVTGTPRSTLHRLIKTLVDARILMREPNGKRYSAGERLVAMIDGVRSHASLHSERRAILKGLVEQIGETCNFTTLDITDVVYVDRVESKWPLGMHLEPGSRVPLHCTSSGKLFLSHMPARQRRRMLYQFSLKRYTEKTIVDPDILAQELVKIRRANISTDDEGYLIGLISVAVPVFGRNRKVIGSVAVHAPRARMELDKALGYVGLLKLAASDLGSLYRQFK